MDYHAAVNWAISNGGTNFRSNPGDQIIFSGSDNSGFQFTVNGKTAVTSLAYSNASGQMVILRQLTGLKAERTLSDILDGPQELEGEHGNEMLEFGKQVGETGHLMVHGVEATLANEVKYFAKAGVLSRSTSAARGAGIAKNVVHGLVIVNVGISIVQGFENGWSAGDVTRVFLSGAVAIPYAGWLYGLTDLGFAIFTDKSLTDRIVESVDEHF